MKKLLLLTAILLVGAIAAALLSTQPAVVPMTASLQQAQPGAASPAVAPDSDEHAPPAAASADLATGPAADHAATSTAPSHVTPAEGANRPAITGQENPGALPAITPEMAQEIRRLETRDPARTVTRTLPDGTVAATPENGFQTTTVAVKGPDGKLVIRSGGAFLSNVKPVQPPANPTPPTSTEEPSHDNPK